MSRYNTRQIERNTSEFYENYLKERGLTQVNQYTTPEFKYPTESQDNQISTIKHTWTYGDRFFKLSYKYYGDVTLWWVIAMYNKKPTEHDIKLGDDIYIPFPAEKVLSYMKP